jgi:hypothetical protein
MHNSQNTNTAVVQIVMALSALILGVLLYAATRSSERVLFLQYLPELNIRFPIHAGAIVYSLPSFLHIYAFVLLTAAVGAMSARQLRSICLFWLLLELLFEFGQMHAISVVIADYWPAWFDHSLWLEAIPGYFVRGTFDPLDVLCLILGVFAAYATAALSGGTGVRMNLHGDTSDI